MNSSVSVALCTYNGATYIAEQLRSILDQSLAPTEIVVADDGSSDGTLEVVAAVLAEARSAIPVRILRGESPLGVTRNFERAVDATTGEFVALCDQDDVWHPDRLSVAVAELEADPAILLWHGDARLVDERGDSLGFTLFESLGIGDDEIAGINGDHPLETYVRRNLVTGATTVFRRSLLDAALPFPASWVHDEWLGVIAAATGRTRVSTRAVVDYRQHSSNEIGVVRPTIAVKVGRMLEPRADRYQKLALRAQDLVERLEALGVDPAAVALARRKRDFEAKRSHYPANRVARLGRILGSLDVEAYNDLSSQRRVDIVRDIVQPA